MFDVLIKGGTLIDGTGADARTADVAIRDGKVAEIGSISETATQVLDADGLLVTPGWVDVHTHYDGQVTWDALLSPSCWHGVTSVVMGNCGVGFAPVAPGQRDYLISLMEGVEDIPGTALAEGIDWAWESFPEYLDAIEGKPHAIDVAAQVPHAALRFYVMGERGADHTERPTPDEIERMGALTREAIDAGAIGFTTSRTKNHRASDGSPTPSLTAGADELLGIAGALAGSAHGVFEVVSDFADQAAEWAMYRRMIELSGRPLSISLAQPEQAPDSWRDSLEMIRAANRDGLPMKAQVPARAIGIVLGLEASLHPFVAHPSFQPLAGKTLEHQVAALRDPELRRQLLSEKPAAPMFAQLAWNFDRIFSLDAVPDYEPAPEQSLAARAARAGVNPAAMLYDLLLEDDGHALLYRPLLNYAAGNLDATREMLLDDMTVPGLGDAGAHCGMICDGSFPTYLLQHWGRDRTRGEKLPLEWLVKRQCADTADLIGLGDRGRLLPGMRADVNLIDFEGLALQRPEIRRDLPAGGKRLLQQVTGYETTLVAGQVAFVKGESTGAMPGALIRGGRQ